MTSGEKLVNLTLPRTWRHVFNFTYFTEPFTFTTLPIFNTNIDKNNEFACSSIVLLLYLRASSQKHNYCFSIFPTNSRNNVIVAVIVQVTGNVLFSGFWGERVPLSSKRKTFPPWSAYSRVHSILYSCKQWSGGRKWQQTREASRR